MSKIRINDLARELEVKSKAILDVLVQVGITEKKTHSSSVEEHEAEKVRAHFRAAEAQSAPSKARTCRTACAAGDTGGGRNESSRPRCSGDTASRRKAGAASAACAAIYYAPNC